MHRFIEERLSLFRELIEAGGFRGGYPFGLDPSRIRFILSRSPREMKVPYLVETTDIDTLEKAILELIYLIKKRVDKNESIGGDMELSTDSISVLKGLSERSYRMDLFLEGSIEEKVAESVLIFIPLIDAGILYGWLGKKGKGKELIGILKKIYLKALEEEVRIEGKELTAYITHIAMLNSIKGIKDRLRKVAIKGLSYERWEYSIGILLFFVMDAVVKDTLNDFNRSHPLYNVQETGFLLKSTLTPSSFISIKNVVTATPINPYYMTTDLIQNILPFSESIINGLEDVDELVEGILVKAGIDEEFTESAIKMKRIRIFKRCIFDYISRYTDHNIDAYKEMEKVFRDERMLQKVILDERLKKRWLKEIEKLKEQFPSDEDRLNIISSIENALKVAKKKLFSGLLRGKLDVDKSKVFADTIRRFLTYRFDEEVERFLVPIKTMLEDKREEVAEKEVLMEYEKGRVYLISSDKRVILKRLDVVKEGQLYIDMKDFTRETFKVKEITMADFMKRHFYKPILEAAGRYAVGAQMMEDSEFISLQNLLGDAFIYSGDIASLVSLAEDIQEIMDRYSKELKIKLHSLNISNPLVGIKKNYTSMKENLAREKELLQQKRVETDKSIHMSEWLDLLDREKDIERAFHEEMDETREIEAGIFISYGAKAENIHLKDDQWGDRDVAIGEKINEASRGVSRNQFVRMRLDRLLEDARKRLQNPHLRLPFDVYIDRMYSLKIDPASVYAIDSAIVHRDVTKAEKLTKAFASRLFLDLKDTIYNRSLISSKYLAKERNIYNKGHALSEDALKAFMHNTRSYTQHFNKKVNLSELNPLIRKNLLFLEDTIDLWFSIKRAENKVLIFRKVGKLVFKGFESAAATTVYEMLKRNSDFYRMIIEYHLNEWLSGSN